MRDNFFTKREVAAYCANIFSGYAKNSKTVEPSAGAGSFYNYTNIHIDIAPMADGIIERDFFKFPTRKYGNYLGNPPFGQGAGLAVKFFNHAAKGKGVIGFILPKSFRKNSIQIKLDANFHLIYDEELPMNSFTQFGITKKVRCVFQIWEYRETRRVRIAYDTKHRDFRFVEDIDDSDFILRVSGERTGKMNAFDNSSATTTAYIVASDEVKRIFIALESKFIEESKNTVAVPCIGKATIVQLYTQYMEKNDDD